MMRMRGSASLAVASVLAVISAAWMVIALVGAFRLERPSAQGTAPPSSAPAAREAIGAVSAHDTLVIAAIEVDPFSPDRSPPATRYGSAPTPTDSFAAETTQGALLKLVGTVIDVGGSSFAMCQLGEATPRAVRVGERIGDYRLRAVRQGAADFAGPEGPITLRVATPAP
jgi:hypothetical protein